MTDYDTNLFSVTSINIILVDEEISHLEQKHRDHIYFLQQEKKKRIKSLSFLCSFPDRRHSYGKGDFMVQSKSLLSTLQL